jgi:hypothetical protein
MRFYIICRGLFPGSKPWVLAETVDEPYARDEANTWKTTFVVSREAALASDELRATVEAWEARDDREYERDMIREDAEAAVESDSSLVEADLWLREPEQALRETLAGRVLTFPEFRSQPDKGGLSDTDVRDAYLEYLQLEAAWSLPVDSTSDR